MDIEVIPSEEKEDAVSDYYADVDCGLALVPCLKSKLDLPRFAKIGIFIPVLCVTGVCHGLLLVYFRNTAQLWGDHYDFPKKLVGWYVIVNEIFVGIFALAVAYWGSRTHKVVSMGSITMFLAIAALALVLPEVIKPYQGIEIDSIIKEPMLCNTVETIPTPTTYGKEFDALCFLVLTVFQFIHALATSSYICLGVTYIDDHLSRKNSPLFTGLVLASIEIGKQLGLYCSWTPYFTQSGRVFTSPVWITVSLVTFITGLILTMFPRELPQLIMKRSVACLANIATGYRPVIDEPIFDGFAVSAWRICRNNKLALNIFAVIFALSAMINFSFVEKYFNQTKYHIPIRKDNSGYSDPEIIQFTTNMLRQPVIAVSMIASAVIVNRIKPRSSNMLWWNVCAYSIAVIVFASTIFINCTRGIKNTMNTDIIAPDCSIDCKCTTNQPFEPVCVDGITYFSGCLAGCQAFNSLSELFINCSCGEVVTLGACDKIKCKSLLATVQANKILIYGFLASTVIPNAIVSIRLVDPKDKALALGLTLTLIGLIPYVPIRYIYNLVADELCSIRGENGICQFYALTFTTYIAALTLCLMIIATIMSIASIVLMGDIPLFTESTGENTPPVVLHTIKSIDFTPKIEETSFDDQMTDSSPSSGGQTISEDRSDFHSKRIQITDLDEIMEVDDSIFSSIGDKETTSIDGAYSSRESPVCESGNEYVKKRTHKVKTNSNRTSYTKKKHGNTENIRSKRNKKHSKPKMSAVINKFSDLIHNRKSKSVKKSQNKCKTRKLKIEIEPHIVYTSNKNLALIDRSIQTLERAKKGMKAEENFKTINKVVPGIKKASTDDREKQLITNGNNQRDRNSKMTSHIKRKEKMSPTRIIEPELIKIVSEHTREPLTTNEYSHEEDYIKIKAKYLKTHANHMVKQEKISHFNIIEPEFAKINIKNNENRLTTDENKEKDDIIITLTPDETNVRATPNNKNELRKDKNCTVKEFEFRDFYLKSYKNN